MTTSSPLRLLTSALAAAALAATAGCGSGSSPAPAEPTPTVAPITLPTLPPGEPGTFTDASGTALKIPARVSKVACLTGICDDALLELGLRPAASSDTALLSDAAFLGDRASEVPAIGGFFGEENLEDVVKADPDLVVGLLGTHDQKRQALAGTAPLWVVSPSTWQESVEFLLRLGALTGREEQARAAAERFAAKLTEARSTIGGDRPSALAIYGTDVNFGVSTEGSLVGSVLKEISDYPWKDRGESGHAAGGATYSIEEVLAQDPDVIFVSTFAFDPSAVPVSKQLAKNPVWTTLPAVAGGRVTEVATTIWESGRGTRSLGLVIDEALPALQAAKDGVAAPGATTPS